MDELEAMTKIAELEKLAKDAKSSSNYWSERHTELSKEVEQLHQLIDLLPNSPPRESEPPEDEKWKTVTYSVQSRLTAWIASRLK